ncbi:MAG TPA: hypothetical protein VEK09_03815, partial [Jatrophihabitantaceae bacterium]|nr:hypothetical protein [Jatrophihabitantaceae bacterium]
YRIPLATGHWLTLSGPFGYVCQENRLRQVLEAAGGVTMRTLDALHDRPCATLLNGRSSAW